MRANSSGVPVEGVEIRHRKTKAVWVVERVDRPPGSGITYLRLKNRWGRNRSITLSEWHESYEPVETDAA